MHPPDETKVALGWVVASMFVAVAIVVGSMLPKHWRVSPAFRPATPSVSAPASAPPTASASLALPARPTPLRPRRAEPWRLPPVQPPLLAPWQKPAAAPTGALAPSAPDTARAPASPRPAQAPPSVEDDEDTGAGAAWIWLFPALASENNAGTEGFEE